MEASETDRNYLLTAFSTMAKSRSAASDRDFIERATLDVFKAGFVFEVNDEGLAKAAKDLLVDICIKHPFLMALLVRQFEEEPFLSTDEEVTGECYCNFA